MEKKKSHPLIAFFLWILFLSGVFGVAYLSVQDGEETKLIGKKLIQYLAVQKYVEAVTEMQLLAMTYQFRQTGRIVAFFAIGILGTLTIHVTFYRWYWVIRTFLSAGILCAIACVTEKCKNYIPSRHYSHEEMMLSVTAVILGFSLVSVIMVLFHVLKEVFDVIARAVVKHQ